MRISSLALRVPNSLRVAAALGVAAAMLVASDRAEPVDAAGPACTTDCYVDAVNGNDANGGASAADAKQTIAAGIAAVSPGGTVHVLAGTYAENVVINKSLTLAGAGEGVTVIVPAVSNPNACPGSSTCGGNSSNVILVGADDVTISNLTVDGDNPALSGIDVGGANVDARNGIITNHGGSGFPGGGTWDNLEIHDVTVQNIFLRGIYASSGGTFSFHDNTVTNVQGDGASIGMFNFGGSGTFADNTVSWTNDGISSNWSQGVVFSGNTVTHSGSGIHTDNAGGGAVPGDVISGNTVSDCKPDGYGIWTFVQYSAATVSGNTVSGCAIGLGAFGGSFSGPTLVTQFEDKTVTGDGGAGSIGVLVQTGTFGYGNTDVAATFTGNVVTGFETGVVVDDSDDPYEPSDTSGPTADVDLERNAIAGNGAGVVANSVLVVEAACNWWGNVSGPSGDGAGTGDSISGNLAAATWLLAASPLDTAPCGTPDVVANANQCKKGGWAMFVREDGTPFNNQGDCVSYTKTGK